MTKKNLFWVAAFAWFGLVQFIFLYVHSLHLVHFFEVRPTSRSTVRISYLARASPTKISFFNLASLFLRTVLYHSTFLSTAQEFALSFTVSSQHKRLSCAAPCSAPPSACLLLETPYLLKSEVAQNSLWAFISRVFLYFTLRNAETFSPVSLYYHFLFRLPLTLLLRLRRYIQCVDWFEDCF